MTTKHTNTPKKSTNATTNTTTSHRVRKTKRQPRRISTTTTVLVILLSLLLMAGLSVLHNANTLKADLYTNVPAQKTSPMEYGGFTKEQFIAFGSDQIKSKSVQAKTEIEKNISSLGLDKDTPLASSSVDVCYPETVSQGWITAYTVKNCYYKKLLVIPTDTPREDIITAINNGLKNNGWELSSIPQSTACYELNQIKKKQSAFSEETRGLYANIYIGGPDYNYKKIVDGQCNVLNGQFQDSSMPDQRTIIDQSLFDEKNIQDQLISKANPTVIRVSFTSEYFSKTLQR